MNKQNIFYSASLKLTYIYLLIIMSISLVFSVGLYRVSSQELERSIHRQPGPVAQILRNRSSDLIEDLIIEQENAVDIAINRLRTNLILINLLILIIGGLISYYLARKTLDPIEDIHEAQRRFTTDASHELRTPISAMRIETEITMTDPKLTLASAKKQLNSNIEELDKLTNLSNSLLSLSRLEDISLKTSNVKIRKIIESATNRVRPLAVRKSISIKTIKIPDISINAEFNTLTEAVVTILDNAVKYSPDNSTVTIKCIVTKQRVNILITDKGLGIKTSDINRIFDRFYRADLSRDKNKEDGYGLGLSIAKASIDAHGGSIKVKSSPKKGSTFTISLPR